MVEHCGDRLDLNELCSSHILLELFGCVLDLTSGQHCSDFLGKYFLAFRRCERRRALRRLFATPADIIGVVGHSMTIGVTAPKHLDMAVT